MTACPSPRRSLARLPCLPPPLIVRLEAAGRTETNRKEVQAPMTEATLVIEVEGGLVAKVSSDNPNVRVIVLDWDIRKEREDDAAAGEEEVQPLAMLDALAYDVLEEYRITLPD